jgi:hypothetical protein
MHEQGLSPAGAESAVLRGAEDFDERRVEPANGWVVVITLVPKNANVERRNGYR